MRLANRTKDYSQIDGLIRENMPKFLYNNGEGKQVREERRFDYGKESDPKYVLDHNQ